MDAVDAIEALPTGAQDRPARSAHDRVDRARPRLAPAGAGRASPAEVPGARSAGPDRWLRASPAETLGARSAMSTPRGGSVASSKAPHRRTRSPDMTSVEQHEKPGSNGATADTIGVENPATGELITTVPVLGAEALAELAAVGREAQVQWEAIGFDGRARIMRRAQKWMLDNADRVLDTVVSETGKTYEDAQLADLGYTVSALGFWAKEGPKYLADERVPSWNNPVAAGQEADHPLRAGRRGRRDRAVELPDRQLVRRLHPGADGRQRRDPQAERGDAAELAADGRDDARVRPARARLPGRHRRRLDRRGADRRRSTASCSPARAGPARRC